MSVIDVCERRYAGRLMDAIDVGVGEPGNGVVIAPRGEYLPMGRGHKTYVEYTALYYYHFILVKIMSFHCISIIH